MGRFSFLPLKGNDYRVYTRLEDETVVTGQLPRSIQLVLL